MLVPGLVVENVAEHADVALDRQCEIAQLLCRLDRLDALSIRVVAHLELAVERCGKLAHFFRRGFERIGDVVPKKINKQINKHRRENLSVVELDEPVNVENTSVLTLAGSK